MNSVASHLISGCFIATVSLHAGSLQAATLDVAIDSSPAGLDPHLITAFNSVVIVQSTIYEGLTRIDKDLAVGPGLATGWTVSDDGKRYVFTLPEGVTFHDGSSFDVNCFITVHLNGSGFMDPGTEIAYLGILRILFV